MAPGRAAARRSGLEAAWLLARTALQLGQATSEGTSEWGWGASYSWDWLVVCHWEEFRNVGCRKEEATAFVEEGKVGHSSSFLALLHCSLNRPAVFDETQNPQILTNLSNPKLFQLGPRGGRGPSSCWQCCCCSLSWTASTTHAITAQLLTDPAFMKLFI